MIPNLEFSTISNSKEAEQLGDILRQCFNFPASSWHSYFNRLGPTNFRVIRRAGRIVGGLASYPMGQWFGGRSVPMSGLAAVGIAPEHRGTGAAAELITQTLKELYANGVPLSALYASTQRLYRKVGYEQAGSYCRFSLPTNSIPSWDHSLPIHPVDPTHHEVFHDLYRQRAMETSGNLDRHQAIWQRLVKPPTDDPIYAYLVGPDHKPEGYIIFSQQPGATGYYNLRIWDLVTLTPAAGRRLWTFLADHRSLANEVLWHGPTVEPLLALLAEQSYQITHLERWLLRIVDVPKALALRGYPAGVEAELHLAIQDDLLPENSRNFILSVSEGRGDVVEGGRGELQLDIRGLAPLYTGLFTPHQLQITGYLEATAGALLIATQLFAGSEPWMPDHF
jgi:predicted acetyltransferase